jgi:hypothetical protein
MPVWRNLAPPFPLTPTLSPWRGRIVSCPTTNGSASNSHRRRRWLSLSLSERAGVRGNKTFVRNRGDSCNWLPLIVFAGAGALNTFRAKRDASAEAHTQDLFRGTAVYSDLQESA